MFSLITILISLIFVLAEAGPYRNYYYNNRGGYNQNYYRTPAYSNQGYGNNYQRQYQGYTNQRQYQGYGNNYNYQRQYQGYGNYYATPAPAAPAFQPSLAQLLFGGARQQPYSSNGINYDSYGNSFVGTKDNGIYLFCNGRGCPGRG